MSIATIAVALKLEGDKLSLSPQRLHLADLAGQRLEWHSEGHRIEIEFSDDERQPFPTRLLKSEAPGVLISDLPRPGLLRRMKFPYKARIFDGPRVWEVGGLVAVGPSDVKPVRISLVGGTTIKVDPDPVTVDRSFGDQVTWTCDDGRFAVEFTGASPFAAPGFAADRSRPAHSGRCRSDALLAEYKYVVRVWPAGSGSPVVLDPVVGVEDDGGDLG